jgi:hypothetical protein
MSNPLTRHIWSAHVEYFKPDGIGGTDGAEWDDGAPLGIPKVLLRTIIDVHFFAYGLYSLGAGGIPNMAMGFGLGETNSHNYNGNPPDDDPSTDFIDYLATGSDALHWTALGWPPNVSGTLSGSINSIDSSGDLELTENLNTYMYGTATIHVDSKAQRSFTGGDPHFKFTLWQLAGPLLLSYDRWAVMRARFLWEQNP